MSAKEEMTCPLCLEEMDVTDQQLKPCGCGYEVCVWCWHLIIDTAEKDGMEGICPACRSPYDKERILEKTISSKRLGELNARKQKPRRSKSRVLEPRAHLASCRVILRNLVYLAGLPVNIADQKILQKKEFLGQYGKVLKVAKTKDNTACQHSCCVFVTFSKEGEAIRCIQAVNGFILDGRPLKASFGTAKYCEAWLKNMPCGIPRCVYLHDYGKPEDICAKEDVVSVCTSRIRQSCGTTFENTHRRSGMTFPPPVQNFRNNAAVSRETTNTVLCYAVDYDRNLATDGGHWKYGGTFNGASSLKASSTILSPKSALAVQGTQVKKPAVSSCSLAPIRMEPNASMQTADTHQNSQQRATSTNYLPFSSYVRESSSLNAWEKKDLFSNSTMEHIGPNVGINSVTEGSINETSNIQRRTNERFCANSRFVSQQSISVHDVIQCSSIGDGEPALLHSVIYSTKFDSQSNLVLGGQAVPCKPKENYVSFLEALGSGLEPSGTISQYILPSHFEKCALPCRESMRSSDELETKKTVVPQSADREIVTSYESITTHFQDNRVDDYKVSSVAIPESYKGDNQNLRGTSSEYRKDKLEVCHADYGCQVAPVYMFQNADIVKGNKRYGTEESIISDILSLDLVPDGPSLGTNLEKMLLCNNDEGNFCPKIPWKSRNSDVSRFCFDRVDDTITTRERTFSRSTDECEHNVNLNKIEMMKGFSLCQPQSLSSLTVSDCLFSEGTGSLCHCVNEHATKSKLHSSLHPSGTGSLSHCVNEHATESKLHSSLHHPALPPSEVTPASKSAFESESLSFSPPGFCPRYTAFQGHSFLKFSNSDPPALSRCVENSIQLFSADSCQKNLRQSFLPCGNNIQSHSMEIKYRLT